MFFAEMLKKGENFGNEYGDIFTFQGLGQNLVVFNNGPHLQTLLKSADFGHVHKTPLIYDQFQPFITNNVLVSDGPFWQRQRKTLLKTQSYQNLKTYIPLLNNHSKKVVDKLDKLFQDEKPHPINAIINEAFLGVISGERFINYVFC